MKNFIKKAFLSLCFLLMISGISYAKEPIKVSLDDKLLSFDTNPVIVNETVLVPFRNVLEELKCDITWNEETKTIIAEKGDTKVQLQVGNNIAKKNGENITLKTKPIIVNNRVLVPLRFISESLDAEISYNNSLNVAIIYTKNDDYINQIKVKNILEKKCNYIRYTPICPYEVSEDFINDIKKLKNDYYVYFEEAYNPENAEEAMESDGLVCVNKKTGEIYYFYPDRSFEKSSEKIDLN